MDNKLRYAKIFFTGNENNIPRPGPPPFPIIKGNGVVLIDFAYETETDLDIV